MSMKLFVGAMSVSTDDEALRQRFSSYGVVLEAKVVLDNETGRSRGFGFVTMECGAAAVAAIEGMSRQRLEGHSLHVSQARDWETPA